MCSISRQVEDTMTDEPFFAMAVPYRRHAQRAGQNICGRFDWTGVSSIASC
jgi:hypothetical protein